MIEVPLSNGKVALIDDEDADHILVHKWAAITNRYKKRENWYAVRYGGDKNNRGRSIAMHREILNAPAGMEVDHINGDGLDNRRSNLRLATRGENLRNWHRPIGKSGYHGVNFRKHKKSRWYQATIQFENKRRSLGFFDCPKEAALVYDAAAKELHGEFAALNFPDNNKD